MDPVQNPFSPGAGSQPPELAGREHVLADVKTALERTKNGASSRSSIFVGLRGVGKTVLLNRAREMAEDLGMHTVSVEAHEEKSLPALLVPHLRGLLLRLNASDANERTRRGLRVLKSFLSRIRAKVSIGQSIDLEIGIDPEIGTADSGDLEHDLGELLVAIAEAAESKSTPVGLFLDELQYLSESELSALIMGLHQVSQRRLPLTMYAAGLPLILGLAGRSKSYSERLFAFPPIGVLDEVSGRRAIVRPIEALGVQIDPAAVDAILKKTEAYPYFLQQWGYETWNAAESGSIRLEAVTNATARAIRQLDSSFFRVRFDRMTKREKEFLFAMVNVGGPTQRSGDIAERLGVKPTSIGPLRSSLIKKGMIYSPAHGDNAFTVPLFDGFLKRQQREGDELLPQSGDLFGDAQ
jgi:hypothetical protein